MALGHASNLLAIAQSGERLLTTQERRLVVQFLVATSPQTTNAEIADWVKVSEKTIRDDKQKARADKAKYLKNELQADMALVIADIAMEFDRQVADIERNKTKCKPGSATYLNSCQAVMDMRLKLVAAYQSIGFLPRNLGALTTKRFDYKAVVLRDGSMQTRNVTHFDGEVEDVEFQEHAQLPEPPKAVPVTPEMQAIIDADKQSHGDMNEPRN